MIYDKVVLIENFSFLINVSKILIKELKIKTSKYKLIKENAFKKIIEKHSV